MHADYFSVRHVPNPACMVDGFYHSGYSRVLCVRLGLSTSADVVIEGSIVLVLRVSPGENQHLLGKSKKKKLGMGTGQSDITPI